MLNFWRQFRLNLISVLFTWALIDFCSLSAQETSEESASIAGEIMDSWNQQPMGGVAVTLRGTTLATTTQADGSFKLENVPAGNHILLFSKSGYQRATVSDIRSLGGQTSTVNLELRPEFFELPPYEVIVEPIGQQTIAILDARRRSSALTDAIGSEFFSRAGVNDAAGILTKVTGASVVDGKFAVIRGLNDRYNATTLNGAEVPSADPYRKAAQLDLFPSAFIEQLVTTKTFTPNLPGSFTGGAVNIVTKTFPEKPTFAVSLGVSYNTRASLNEDFLTYDGGDYDYFAYDDGTRALPEELEGLSRQEFEAKYDPPYRARRNETAEQAAARRAAAEDLDRVTRLFSPVMSPEKETSPLNHNFSISGGNTFNIKKQKLGVFSGLTYDRSFSFFDDGVVNRYLPGGANGGFTPRIELKDTQAIVNVNWGSMVNTAYKFSDNHQVSFNFLYNRNGEDVSRIQKGFNRDTEGVGPEFNTVSLHYTERELQSFQLHGEHEFPDALDLKTEWTAALANTTQDEPDFRTLTYISGTPTGLYIIPEFLAGGSPTRYFRQLNEQNVNYKIDNTLPFTVWNELEAAFLFGGYLSSSERSYEERAFIYEDDRNISFSEFRSTGDLSLLLADSSMGVEEDPGRRGVDYLLKRRIEPLPADNLYDGQSTIEAGYLMLEVPIVEKVKLIGGARIETTDIQVDFVSSIEGPGSASLQETDLLPAAGLIYEIWKDMNLRFSYGKTIARPNYREIANVTSFEFVGSEIIFGNPNLDRALIDNFDVRWEWFFRPGEIISFGVFYKDLKNAIEQQFQSLQGGNEAVTWSNRDAQLYGLEFEARKRLDFVDDLFKGFTVGANFALIESQVQLSSLDLVNKRAFDPNAPDTRPLYDQSPYIINADISYDHPSLGTSVTLLYNIYGERLAYPALNTSDIYEQPFETLDFTLSQRFGRQKRWNAKFSAKNLLDPKRQLIYEDTALVFSEYRRGRTFGMSLGYEF